VKPGLVTFFSVLSVCVWTFALIGVVSVATTIASPNDAAPTRPPSLLAPAAEVDGADAPGLPRFRDSERTEYRQGMFGEQLVTEVQYVGADPMDQVREYYATVFEREGWTVTSASVLRREWTYTVASGDREATVAMKRMDGATEVEVVLVAPAPARDRTTDR